MFCHKCGTEIADGMGFCHKCGAAVVNGDVQPQTVDTPQEADSGSEEGIPDTNQAEGVSGQDPTEGGIVEQDTPVGHGPSRLKRWWDSASKVKKVLAVAVALVVGVVVLNFLVSFLREFGYLIFGGLVLIGFLVTVFTGTKEERADAKKTFLKMLAMFAAIVVIVLFFVSNSDSVSDIVQPGTGVRNAYLTQYSDKVTVEEAFDNFFANGKWSTYKADGYSYVTFTGTCEYLGERVDARITFQITGEKFRVDRLDINGVEQSDLILAVMLEKIYEEY